MNIAFLYLSHRSANADVHIYTLSSEVYLTNEGVRTIVPSPKWPDGASILWQSNSVGASTWHLSNIADVFDQGRNVAAVAVTVTCIHTE